MVSYAFEYEIAERKQLQVDQMRKRKKNSGGGVVIAAVLVALALVAAVGIGIYVIRFAPSKTTMALEDYFVLQGADDCAVILNGEYLSAETADSQTEGEESSTGLASIREGQLYLSLSFVKDYLDSGYVFDSTEGQLRYCTADQIIAAEAGSPSYSVSGSPVSAAAPVVVQNGEQAWLLADFVMEWTDVACTLHTDPWRVVIDTAGHIRTVAELSKEEAARRYGGIKSDVLTTVAAGDTVMVLEDYGDWAKVLTPDAVIGCVRTSLLKDMREETAASRLPERVYQHISLGQTIVAGWHQVVNASQNANVTDLLEGTCVNVVLPTWFVLKDNTGAIASFADPSYVQTCHARGVQVWGLVSNITNEYDFDTTTVLNTTSSRENLINNLMAEAAYSGMDGINIDIESLQTAAGDGFMELVRELSIRCEQEGLVLSVDNYPPSSYTQVYNRPDQAKYADYHFIMGYDEHWGGGEEGSVSSYLYVKDAVEGVMESTDAGQIVLGLPFYTRIWTIDDEGGTSSQTLTIAGENNHLASVGLSWDDAEWLDFEQQYFVEYQTSAGTNHIWLEEQDSLRAKMTVATDYQLAGVCFWRLGQEPKNMWTTIEASMYGGQ